VQHTDRCALSVARTIYLLGKVLRPLSRVLVIASNFMMLLLPGRRMPEGPFVSDEDLRLLVDIDDDEESEEEEQELIHSVFEFSDTIVREVMVPRPDMVTLPSDATLEQALETITQAGYSRIPIFEGDIDNIVGVLYAKDLLKRSTEDGSTRAASLGRAPLFVPEQKKLAELLREMQEQRVHMAIVIDEYGGTAGLVTIEDLVEEIVGEIVDEYDKEEPLVEPLGDGALRVDAKLSIDEVNELLGVELPDDDLLNATAGHPLGLKLDGCEAHGFTLHRYPAGQLVYEAPDRVPVVIGQLDSQQFVDLVDGQLGVDSECSIAEWLHKRILFVVLIDYFSDDLLD